MKYIHVDLLPNRDEIYSGICLKWNEELFVFICFDDESKEFNGYGIVRNDEVEKYREWDEEELSEIENDNSSDFVGKLPLDKMGNLLECLNYLKNETLVSIFNKSDDDCFWVGRIINLSENEVELNLIDEEGNEIGNERIRINDIAYIGFASEYEKKLSSKNTFK